MALLAMCLAIGIVCSSRGSNNVSIICTRGPSSSYDPRTWPHRFRTRSTWSTTPAGERARRASEPMSDIADAILALHGAAALGVVFLLPALEASAFIGFVFPGEIAVLLASVLAAEHRVALAAVIAVAILGAVVGDTIGYWIGRRYGERIIGATVGRIIKREHLHRGQAYLVRRGGRAVFIGRFTVALRVLIPGLAGMSGLHYPTFAFWNVAGGVVWATAFVVLGYAAGESWRQVEHVAKRASLLVLVLLVVFAGGTLVARWVARHPEGIRGFAGRVLDRPAPRTVIDAHRRLLAFLAARLRPGEALGLELTLG